MERAGFPESQRRRYWLDIVSFLKRCRDRHAPASVALIREHLGEVRHARTALEWFYREAKKRGKVAAGSDVEVPGRRGGDAAGRAMGVPACAGRSRSVRRGKAGAPGVARRRQRRRIWAGRTGSAT